MSLFLSLTDYIDLEKCHAVLGYGNDPQRKIKNKDAQNPKNKHKTSIMSLQNELLYGMLEFVFVVKIPTMHLFFNLIKTFIEVHDRLLVVRRRMLEICLGALELQRVFVISKKLKSDDLIEWRAAEAIISRLGFEEADLKPSA